MSPITTRIGSVIFEDTGLGREIIQNYKDVGVDILAKTVTPEARTNFNGLYRNGDYGDVKEVFSNLRTIAAVRRTLEAVINCSVTYIEATVSTLLFH